MIPLLNAILNDNTEVAKYIVEQYPQTIYQILKTKCTKRKYTALNVARRQYIRQLLIDEEAKGSMEIELIRNNFTYAFNKDITFLKQMPTKILQTFCEERFYFPILSSCPF